MISNPCKPHVSISPIFLYCITLTNFYFDFTFTVLYNKSNKNQSNTPKNIFKRCQKQTYRSDENAGKQKDETSEIYGWRKTRIPDRIPDGLACGDGVLFIALAGMVDSLMVSSIGAYAVAAVGLTTQPKFIGLCIFIAMNVSVSAGGETSR